MRTETIANRNLREYIERNNNMPTREDVINILSMLPLFISNSFEMPRNIEVSNNTENTKLTKTSNKKSNNIEKTSTRRNKTNKINTKSSAELLEDVRNLQSKLGKAPTMEDLREANIDVTPLLKTCGGWRNLKKSLNDTSEVDSIIDLMNKLNKIPTREDLKTNNVNIDNLMLHYGSWRNIKKELKLEDKYEEIVKNQLIELKKTEKLSMENCKSNNIDIAFLIRKYGGWKEVLKNFGLK